MGFTLEELSQELARVRAQKDQAYSERNKILGLLAWVLKTYTDVDVAVARHDPADTEWEKDWRTILVIRSEHGQMTWHFHDTEKPMLEELPLHSSYIWDGHSTDEKYYRLMTWINSLRKRNKH